MRRSLARRYLVGALALSALVGLTACSSGPSDPSTPSGEPQTGGTLKVAIDLDPYCFDGQQNAQTALHNVVRQFLDSLTIYDPETKELNPWLAESWEVNDDMSEFTFHLRDDVTFSNGEQFTAEHVKANFDRIISLGALSVKGSGYLQGYVETEIVDDYTAIVKFDRPRVSFLTATADSVLGMYAMETIETAPEATCLGENLIGSGPFVVSQIVKSERISLVKREGYNWAPETMAHQGEAYLDGIDFSILPERSVRVGALQSGQVDASMGIPPLDAAGFTASGFQVLTFSNPGIPNNLSVNSKAIPDVEMRRALQKSIDREEIRQIVYGGTYDEVRGAISPSTIGFIDLSDHLAYDPDGAKAYFESQGWTMGSSGFYEKDGQILSFTSAHIAPGNDVLFEMVQQQLARVGVQLQLNGIEASVATESRRNGTFNTLQTQQTSLDPDVIRSLYSPVSGSNGLQLDADSELGQLIEGQAYETDVDKRMEMIEEIQRILVEDAYLLLTNIQTQVQVATSNVQGLSFNLNANLSFYDVQLTQ